LSTPLAIVKVLVSGRGGLEALGHPWGGAGKGHANGRGNMTGNGRKLYHATGLWNAP